MPDVLPPRVNRRSYAYAENYITGGVNSSSTPIFLSISAIANTEINPFGQLLQQFRVVRHLNNPIGLFSASNRSAISSSREPAIQRYDYSSTAEAKYSSEAN